jgi:adenylate cyclase
MTLSEMLQVFNLELTKVRGEAFTLLQNAAELESKLVAGNLTHDPDVQEALLVLRIQTKRLVDLISSTPA